jgi:mannose-1-phosphate guanylyltransferase
MVHIVLCGGSGTRLWPLSRKHFPKQFCPLVGKSSLFQKTIERNAVHSSSRIIVAGADHFFMAVNQISECDSALLAHTTFLLEPCPRNTAPAIALACLLLPRDESVLVTPSDHLIGDPDEYGAAVHTADALAKKGYIATFGITPAYAETGYGYIESGEPLSGSTGVFAVKSFREKPDSTTAEEYISRGTFFWNSGMFAFTAGTFLDELKTYAPDLYAASCAANEKASKAKDASGHTSVQIALDDMKKIPSNSIDYAVMEKSAKVALIRSSFSWNDLGSFDSLYDVLEKDKDGNTVSESHINIDSHNNLIVSYGKKLATVGLSDCIIVDTHDALLVGSRGSSQLVKKAVETLEKGSESDKALSEFHQTVHRPWGTYTVLEEGRGYKIKRIVVYPGKRLSLQKHNRRSEHWVVVDGSAKVTVGNQTKTVNKNESTYIPIGELHRLENADARDLSIIETQVGEYLGEDDIIRVEDDFKRTN